MATRARAALASKEVRSIITTVPPASTRVLIAGYSTRAAAESASRAGYYDVTSVDAFADLDHHPRVRAFAVAGPFSAHAAAEAAAPVECDAVAYLSNFENDPDAVTRLAAGRALWGNPPDVLRAVRDPQQVSRACSQHGLNAPALAPPDGRPALVKPLASGGGTHVRPWTPGTPVPEGHYLQEYIEGTPGSIAFVASPQGVRVLGVFQQLVGGTAFGASGFRYCGNILDISTSISQRIAQQAVVLAETLAATFSLVGANGIDVIRRDDMLYPIEVNPRWTGSMELVERAYGISVFGLHATACTSGHLPQFDATSTAPMGRCIGKAVIYARQRLIVGDTQAWCVDDSIRDIPRPGTVIGSGDPVCTVFADGPTTMACEAELTTRATVLHNILRTWADEPHA